MEPLINEQVDEAIYLCGQWRRGMSKHVDIDIGVRSETDAGLLKMYAIADRCRGRQVVSRGELRVVNSTNHHGLVLRLVDHLEPTVVTFDFEASCSGVIDPLQIEDAINDPYSKGEARLLEFPKPRKGHWRINRTTLPKILGEGISCSVHVFDVSFNIISLVYPRKTYSLTNRLHS